jgi:hypothetical protein
MIIKYTTSPKLKFASALILLVLFISSLTFYFTKLARHNQKIATEEFPVNRVLHLDTIPPATITIDDETVVSSSVDGIRIENTKLVFHLPPDVLKAEVDKIYLTRIGTTTPQIFQITLFYPDNSTELFEYRYLNQYITSLLPLITSGLIKFEVSRIDTLPFEP